MLVFLKPALTFKPFEQQEDVKHIKKARPQLNLSNGLTQNWWAKRRPPRNQSFIDPIEFLVAKSIQLWILCQLFQRVQKLRGRSHLVVLLRSKTCRQQAEIRTGKENHLLRVRWGWIPLWQDVQLRRNLKNSLIQPNWKGTEESC